MHLAKCGRWREALAVFDRMPAKGVAPNSFCLNATLDACAAAGEWRQCLAVLERARRSGLEANEFSYNICIAACGAGKQWERALALLREMEGAWKAGTAATPPTIGTYGATIKALGMSGKWRESLEVFREAQGLGGRGEGAAARVDDDGDDAGDGDAVPDVVTYTTLVAALGQSGRTAEAKQIWEEMVASGVKPNVVTYHAMIAAYGNAAAAAAAANVPGAVAAPAGQDAPQGSPRPPLPPPPRQAEWAEALRFFNDMPLAGIAHTSSSYGAAIAAAGQCGLWEEAVALLERIREIGRNSAAVRGAAGARPKGPPLAPDNYVFAAAISACGDNGKWEQALRWVNWCVWWLLTL